MKTTFVVACINPAGEADLFVSNVEVTRAQITAKVHHPLAIRAAERHGFTGPFIVFDQNEFPNIHRAYGAIPCETGAAHRIGSLPFQDPSTGRTTELAVFKGGIDGALFAIDPGDADFSADPGAVRAPFTGQRLVLLGRAPVTLLVGRETHFLSMDYSEGVFMVIVPGFMTWESASFTLVEDALEYFDHIREFLSQWSDFQAIPRNEESGLAVISKTWHSFQERTSVSKILDWFADRYLLSKELTLNKLPPFELVSPTTHST